MTILQKWQAARKLKKSDIDATIATIKKRTEFGPDPESEEYKQLQELLAEKMDELDNVQDTINDIQEQLRYITSDDERFDALRKARAQEIEVAGKITDEIVKLQEKMGAPKPGSEEFARLRKDLEQELKNKKLVKEMKFMGLSADKILMVAVILIIAGFGFALDLESPKALKIAQFALKLPICKV